MLREYTVLEKVYVRDKGLAFSLQENRFEALNEEQSKRMGGDILVFNKGDIVKGATRTEIGKWLLRRDKLEEV